MSSFSSTSFAFSSCRRQSRRLETSRFILGEEELSVTKRKIVDGRIDDRGIGCWSIEFRNLVLGCALNFDRHGTSE